MAATVSNRDLPPTTGGAHADAHQCVADESGATVADGLLKFRQGTGTGTGAGVLAITSGTVTLSAANTYTGGTNLTGGEVVAGNSAALGSGTLALAAGTTLGFSGSGLTLANAITLTGDPTFDVAAGQTETLSGAIADAGGGEVLIPALALANGTTITQEHVASITYWHVELDSHDVVLAENLPCESYLEMGNRAFFAEAEATALHGVPDAATTHVDFCRPFHAAGPLVDAARARLDDLAERLGAGRGRRPAAG